LSASAVISAGLTRGDPRRILVLRGGALGDFIVTLPALAALRTRWPEARIEWIGNPAAAALALHRGLIDAVHSQHEQRWAGLYGVAALPVELAHWLATFDMILSYWPDPDHELAARFPLRAGQTFLSAVALPTLAPAAAHYCAPLRELGLSPDAFWYPLRRAQPEADFVALHPGSGSPRKNWPVAHWLTLGRWLERERRCRVLVLTGEAEPAGVLGGVGQSLHSSPLDEVADQLARCSLFVGHDSGISHLAAAVGARCLLLFGSTDPAMWAPPTSRVSVLRRGQDVATIALAEVQSAVTATLQDRS
jgi:ADP-heptose:LPS heptosyltransferase